MLDKARELFYRQGYARTTLSQIARSAGLPESSLIREFKDKTALLAELVRQLRESTLETWKREAARHDDPLARLHAIIDCCWKAAGEHAQDFRILHQLIPGKDADGLSLLTGYCQDCETFLAQLIGEGQQAGVFRRSLDSRVGAWQIMHTIQGHLLARPLGIPFLLEPDFQAHCTDCLVHCLLKTDV